jgi:hypothetical protein
MPLLTEAQMSDVKLDLTNAVIVERAALAEFKQGKFRSAEGTLESSLTALGRVENTLKGHDLGGIDVLGPVQDASFWDERASSRSRMAKTTIRPEQAIDQAIMWKNWALHLLPRVPTQERPYSLLPVCAFTISSTRVGVEVSGQPGQTGSVRVSDANGKATGAKEYTVPSTGTAVIAPLGRHPTGTARIDIFLGNEARTIRKKAGGRPASGCTPSPFPKRTAMGSLSNGTGSALAYSIETNTAANAFELTLPQGNSITGTSTPTGFNCTDTANVEECKNGSVQPNTPITGVFNHTGTIAANCGCVQFAFSPDNGKTWFTPATLTGPPSSSPPTVTISAVPTWRWGPHGDEAYVCVNLTTSPPQSFVSADIFGPSGYHASTNGKWALDTTGSLQLSAPTTLPGGYTYTLDVYGANADQTATTTGAFTVAAPGTDGPTTNPACPQPPK